MCCVVPVLLKISAVEGLDSSQGLVTRASAYSQLARESHCGAFLRDSISGGVMVGTGKWACVDVSSLRFRG